MNIGFDATPAAAQTAGVGRYARELLRAMVIAQPEHRYTLLMAASERQAAGLLDLLPPGAWRETRQLPAGARAMTEMWQRQHFPFNLNRYLGNIDVYHGPDFVLPPIAAPCVVTIHDLSFVKFPQYAEPSLVRYLSKAVPSAINRASAIIAVSAAVAVDIVEAFPNARDRIFAIPHGVSVPESIPLAETKDRPRILIVGTVEPRKNHLALIAAMELVWLQYPEAKLVIAGREGWKSADIVAEITSRRTRDQVDWIVEPSDSELENVYACADVAVYPSHYEGFGLPVLEAMVRGIPVITSDTPALKETGGNAALYTAPDDIEGLAECIVRLLQDSALRSELATAGRQQAENFSWDATARKTFRAYEFATTSF